MLLQEQMEARPAEIVALEAADTNAIEEVNLAYENVKVGRRTVYTVSRPLEEDVLWFTF